MKRLYIVGFMILFFSSPACLSSQSLPEEFIKKYDSANSSLDKGKCILRYFGNDVGKESVQKSLVTYFLDHDDNIGLDYIKLFIHSNQTNAAGDFTRSLKESFEILSRFEKRKDRYGQMWTLATLANSFSTAKNYDTALVYYKKELVLAKAFNDSSRQGNIINDIAYTYYEANKPDSGIKYAKQAVDMSRNYKYDVALIYPLSTLGENYLAKQEYDTALSIIRECSKIPTTDSNMVSALLNDLVECFMGLNNNDSVLYYSKLAMATAERNNLKIDLLRCYENLYKFFDKINIADSSNKYFRLATIAKDSIYNIEKMRLAQEINFSDQLRRQEELQQKQILQNKIKFYSLLAGVLFFIIVSFFLYRSNSQKQKAKSKIEKAYSELKTTQQQLIQSEKMASLGELTAGIAHEIQNPLNFVNNFSDVNKELIDEMQQEIDKGNHAAAKDISNDIRDNEQKINHHGKRADAIVKNMLQHSRNSTGKNESTDINALADEYLRLAYHGLRAKDKSFNATMKTDFDDSIGKINIIPQDIGRVVLNLINNAFYAVDEKKKQGQNGYEPTVSVSTKKNNGKVEIKVADNGNGIPQKVLDKIFQPFFTTKPTGQGTGLGLSLSYDIVKSHGGELKVETLESKGSEFIISLPF